MPVRFSTGLRDKLFGAGRATVHFSLAANTISFDNASSEIRDSGNQFITKGALVGDKVYSFGTSSNNTSFTITSLAAGVLGVTPAPTDEAAGTVFALVAASGTDLDDVMRNCVVYAYTGSQPATADAAVGTATNLVIYSNNGLTFVHGTAANGLNWTTSSDGVISFPASTETAKGTGLTNGTIGWLRICANPADSGLASTTLPRIDMDVSTASTATAVGATAIETGKSYYLNTSTLTFPYQYGA